MSKRDRAQRQMIRDTDQRLGPDRSEVIYRFPDGWTMRRPGTHDDLLREGELLRNCLRDTEDHQVPFWEHEIRSLRDPTNFPHAHFMHVIHDANGDTRGETNNVLGRANGRLKDAYLERIHKWHRTLPYPTCIVPGTDIAEIVHEFADLWTIRRPQTAPGMLPEYAEAHTLRDPYQAPQATFRHRDGITTDVRGCWDGTVRDGDLARIEAWHDALPYEVTLIEIPELQAA